MTPERFEKILTDQVAACIAMLRVRGVTYAYGDRLSNFKKAAALQGTSPEDALAGMMAKHTIALFDFIEGTRPPEDIQDTPAEQWQEKITDSINYLILLRALLEDTGRCPRPGCIQLVDKVGGTERVA